MGDQNPFGNGSSGGAGNNGSAGGGHNFIENPASTPSGKGRDFTDQPTTQPTGSAATRACAASIPAGGTLPFAASPSTADGSPVTKPEGNKLPFKLKG